MTTWQQISFTHPWVLLLLLLLPLGFWLNRLRLKRQTPAWRVPFDYDSPKLHGDFRAKLNWIPALLRMCVFALLIVVLARPRGNLGLVESTKEVVDMQLAIDVSLSMLAKDFQPNRLEVSKTLAAEFIQQRTDDRIGLVVFSGESFTQCPMTADYRVLLNRLEAISIDNDMRQGTAIGLGLAKAVARLSQSEAKSKVVILLTDGVNNTGQISPLTAAQMARTFGIRVYAIGVGKQGMALSPVGYDFFGQLRYGMSPVEIDEALLTDIAQQTGGAYFRATNQASLKQVFKEIDRLEKTKVKITEYQKQPDIFWPFLWLASGLFGLEWLLRLTLWNSLSL